jgi:hypothetical protein
VSRVYYYAMLLGSISILCLLSSCRQSEGEFNNELRLELLQMMDEDQRIRQQVTPETKDSLLLAQMHEVDRKNASRMKEIVDTYGWPGKTLVGEDGASAAWLLVQHAERDLAFQRRCLGLMQEAANRDEVSLKELAFLTDRVRCSDGRKQLYGTQLEIRSGALYPRPIEDEPNVDKRRAEVGLTPLEEYVETMRAMHRRQSD